MIRTLTKLGEDYALVIDQAILDLLHIDSDTPLSLSTNGKSLLIVPEGTDEEIGDEQFNDILHTVNQRYAQVFRRLAQ